MKVFFGRINLNQEPTDQYEKAYYHSVKGTSYFSELNNIDSFEDESVYVFMIGGISVELWKASHWGKNGQNLYFKKTKVNLDDMTRAWLASFRYFFLNADLIVFTTRRPFKKAFFNIVFHDEFTEEMLLNPATYSNLANYRNIQLQISEPLIATYDLIFYKNDHEWKFKTPVFFDESLVLQFRDNTTNIGKGRTNKDNKLNFINNSALPASFDPSELTLLNVYDIFFCDYNGFVEHDLILKLEENFFKISMSPKDISDTSFDSLIGAHLVIVHQDTASKGTSNEKQGDNFKSKIKIGDYFYLCRGNKNFVAIAKFTSEAVPCIMEELGHNGWLQRSYVIIKEADIDEKYAGQNKWWTPNNNSTCIQIPDEDLLLANKLIFVPYFSTQVKKNKEEAGTLVSNGKVTNHNNQNISLNSILYGPPGTGKTYSTVNEALKILNVNVSSLTRNEVKQKFTELQKSKHVFFTAFHQNMAYEDFIEGIKPVDPEEEDEFLKYHIQDGLFMQACVEAAFNFINSNSEEENIVQELLDYNGLFDKLFDRISDAGSVKLQTKSGGTITAAVTSQGNLSIKHAGRDKPYTVSRDRLSRIYELYPEPDNIANIQNAFRNAIGGCNATAYWAVLNAIAKIRDTEGSEPTKSTDSAELSYLDKRKIVQKFWNKNEYKVQMSEKSSLYVFISEEINRGNVAQIFGELITLIEEDKRMGKPEAISAQLPYSKNYFSVPPNLHILGTMNTADRSVEALDSALRRRFSFVPMMPDEAKLMAEFDSISLKQLLTSLNKRLKVLKDNDHTIGHAWLWNVTDFDGLKKVFKNKIIPLLQEYFYNDYEKLELVLGNQFVVVEHTANNQTFARSSNSAALANQYKNKKVYAIKQDIDETSWTPEDFISIYFQPALENNE